MDKGVPYCLLHNYIVKKDKDFEKRVKEIATDVITELFRILWQHNGIFKNLRN